MTIGLMHTPAPKVEPSEFLGITAVDCCVDCHMGHCVISGEARCLHPRKGGPSPADQMNPAVLRRRNEARRQIAVADANAEARRAP